MVFAFLRPYHLGGKIGGDYHIFTLDIIVFFIRLFIFFFFDKNRESLCSAKKHMSKSLNQSWFKVINFVE